MLIDFHAHSSGISWCCRIPCDKVLDEAKAHGIDGIFLTNHYQKYYVEDGDALAFAKRYTAESLLAKKYANEKGMRVFFGIEATMHRYQDAHILIIGVDESFPLEHPTLYDYTIEELSSFVHEKGALLVQAHPFRNGVNRLVDLKCIDGLELSCHPLYDGTYTQRLDGLAKDNGLFLTCGGDYHADTYRPHCGVYLPDELKTEKEVADFLRSTPFVDLQVHDLGDELSHKLRFVKNQGCVQNSH